MVKQSMAKTARRKLKKAAQTGSKKVTSVAGEALGAAAVAATSVILRQFAEALGTTKRTEDTPQAVRTGAMSGANKKKNYPQKSGRKRSPKKISARPGTKRKRQKKVSSR